MLREETKLTKASLNVNGKDDATVAGPISLGRGMTALSWACYYGHAGIVELLLRDYKVDVETRDAVYERTPLMWASGFGYTKVMALLLDVGKAKLDSRDKKGLTALSFARLNNQLRAVAFLKQRGCPE